MQRITRRSLSVLAIALAGCVSRGGKAVEVSIASSSPPMDFPCAAVAPGAGSASCVEPDTLPAELADPTKWVSGGAHFAGTIVRDIVVVVFRSGTSQSDRQAALELVHGVVVGSRRLSATQRLYLVRVPTDGTIEPLFHAIGVLRTLPSVSIAMPEEIIRNVGQQPSPGAD